MKFELNVISDEIVEQTKPDFVTHPEKEMRQILFSFCQKCSDIEFCEICKIYVRTYVFI